MRETQETLDAPQVAFATSPDRKSQFNISKQTANVDTRRWTSRRRQSSGFLTRLRNLLPILLQVTLTQSPITPTNCDDGLQMQLQMQPFDVSQDLDDQLSAQLNQLKTIDYFTHQQQQQQQQHQATTSDELMTGSEGQDHFKSFADGLVGDEEDWPESVAIGQQVRDTQTRNRQFLEDLLDAQSNQTSLAATPDALANNVTSHEKLPLASPAAQPTNSTPSTPVTTTTSTTIASPSAATATASKPTKTPTSLLSQLTGQASQSTNYEAFISGFSNSILGSLRNQTASVGNKVRKTLMAANSQLQSPIPEVAASASVRPLPNVGQSIDGNIEYDSNQNAINGFIEFPSFGLNGSQKLTAAALKPLVFAALKTVPIKLGSVGWKLLQLIAWKKIYKTHHPSSGEIVVEQEMRHRHPTQHLTHGGRMASADSQLRPQKSVKMGRSYSALRDPLATGSAPIIMNTNYPPAGQSAWPYASPQLDTGATFRAPPVSGYQHLLARHLAPGQMASTVGSSHPAVAAAAAAAATAAFQAQIAHQQQQQQQQTNVDSVNQLDSLGQGNTSGEVVDKVNRKRGLFSGDWLANPSSAYGGESSQQQQQQQQLNLDTRNKLGRRKSGLSLNFDRGVFNQDSSSSLYQGLFDTANTLALQNSMRFRDQPNNLLDQADSLYGSSSPFTLGETIGDTAPWADESSHQRPNSQPSAGYRGGGGSDNLETTSDFDDSPLDGAFPADNSQMWRRQLVGY